MKDLKLRSYSWLRQLRSEVDLEEKFLLERSRRESKRLCESGRSASCTTRCRDSCPANIPRVEEKRC
jgi:hypothetical protein